MKSVHDLIVRAIQIGITVSAIAFNSANAGDLRPLDLPSQHGYAAAAAQPVVDPRVYDTFAQSVRTMSAKQRDEAAQRYRSLRATAAQNGSTAELRHYDRLLVILQGR